MILHKFILTAYVLATQGLLRDLRDYFGLVREILNTSTRLSVEDQAAVNEIYDTAVATSAKIDAEAA